MNIDSRQLGKAGEHRVIAELILHGLNPYVVELDNGVDLVLENGKKIQIKSATLRYDGHPKYRSKRYTFVMRKAYYRGGNRQKDRRKEENREVNYREYKDGVDFVICWGIDNDIFYIVPTKELPRSELSIYPPRLSKEKSGRPSKYDQYLNAWNLLRNGAK